MDSKINFENLEKLKKAVGHLGVDLLSSARIRPEQRESFHRSIRTISGNLGFAIVLGIRLSEQVLRTVIRAPTWTYYHHYRAVNFALDQAALFITGECQRMGYRALPVPASQILDWERLEGHLCHKELGALAGLGWRGRNNLLVNPDYGAQVRYATVLTDLPLPDGDPSDVCGNCGSCIRCIEVCPVGAIHEDAADFELDRCAAQLRRFSRSEKLNSMICGLCVRVCSGRIADMEQSERLRA